MHFGEPTNIIIKINGDTLETVKFFKFLGVITESNGSYRMHLEKRRSLFMTGIAEIQRLGINKRDVPIGMKSLLFTSLVCSKLTYGLETIKLTATKIKTQLSQLESSAIKIACGLNLRSRSTALLYAMGITPIALYLFKRKINFILQLLKNTATSELITKGIHASIRDTIEKLDIKSRYVDLGEEIYRGIIRSRCLQKLAFIKETENKIRGLDLVLSISYLFGYPTPDNMDTLQYLLDPRRSSMG